MKRFKLKIAFDCDDTLFECMPYALELANKDYGYDPPLSINEIDGWGYSGKRTDIMFEYYKKSEFYETQPLIKGAKEFIRKISRIAEVFFITATDPEFMTIRAKRLIEEFPDIPASNIIMGNRKDLVNVDILFDDAAHNILSSSAPYPVLFRKPWNQYVTGTLAANNYDEFFTLVEEIRSSYMESDVAINEPVVIALIGPSGSNKTEIVNALKSLGKFEKPITSTTRSRSINEPFDAYHFKSKEQFVKEKDEGHFFETTMYAGHGFGTKKEDVECILKSSKHAVIPIDMCGAMAMKLHFKNSITVFVKRDKKKLLENALSRDCSIEEKINRIISIDAELRNEDLCDFTIDNNGTIERSIDQMAKILGGNIYG